jgi:hypothetical protein
MRRPRITFFGVHLDVFFRDIFEADIFAAFCKQFTIAWQYFVTMCAD